MTNPKCLQHNGYFIGAFRLKTFQPRKYIGTQVFSFMIPIVNREMTLRTPKKKIPFKMINKHFENRYKHNDT